MMGKYFRGDGGIDTAVVPNITEAERLAADWYNNWIWGPVVKPGAAVHVRTAIHFTQREIKDAEHST